MLHASVDIDPFTAPELMSTWQFLGSAVDQTYIILYGQRMAACFSNLQRGVPCPLERNSWHKVQ